MLTHFQLKTPKKTIFLILVRIAVFFVSLKWFLRLVKQRCTIAHRAVLSFVNYRFHIYFAQQKPSDVNFLK